MRRALAHWIGVFREAGRRFADDDHAVYAGHMAFTMLMSLGPFIICAIILAQQIDPDAALHLTTMIEQMRTSALIPDPMAALLTGVVERVARPADEMQFSGGDWVSLAVLAGLGLFAGSSAFEAARNGFNEAYDTRDRRHFIFRRFQSHLLAFGIAMLFVVVSVLFVTAAVTLSAVTAIAEPGELSGGDGPRRLVLLAVFAVVVIFMFWALLLGVHVTLPRGYVKRWHLYVWAKDEIDDIRAVRVPLKPGVRFTTFVWIVFAVVYSFVIGTIVKLDANHGPLAGVVATLIFFYVSAALIFFGAQVNIAIATIDANGKPKWPHPHVPRPVGFDETRQDAYRVLAYTQPKKALRNRLVHIMRGGSACRRPDDVITDEALLLDKQRALDVLGREARRSGALEPRRDPVRDEPYLSSARAGAAGAGPGAARPSAAE